MATFDEIHATGPTPGMSRYRVEETGEVVTGWRLHNNLIHDVWDVDRSRMDSEVGDSPDVWAIVDDEGEERTLRRIADVPADAEIGEPDEDG